MTKKAGGHPLLTANVLRVGECDGKTPVAMLTANVRQTVLRV